MLAFVLSGIRDRGQLQRNESLWAAQAVIHGGATRIKYLIHDISLASGVSQKWDRENADLCTLSNSKRKSTDVWKSFASTLNPKKKPGSRILSFQKVMQHNIYGVTENP